MMTWAFLCILLPKVNDKLASMMVDLSLKWAKGTRSSDPSGTGISSLAKPSRAVEVPGKGEYNLE